MTQFALHVLSTFCVQHGDALKTRMKITTNPYNVHDGFLSSESCFRKLKFTQNSREAVLLCNQAAPFAAKDLAVSWPGDGLSSQRN
jgi:hypothetical protein